MKNTTRKRPLSLLCGFLALLMFSPAAQAAPVRFDFSTTCTSACSRAGLDVGDALTGYFLFDSAGFNVGPRIGYQSEDVIDFSITAGNLTIDRASSAGFNFSTFDTGDDSGTRIDRWSFVTSTALSGFGGTGFSVSSEGLTRATAASRLVQLSNSTFLSFRNGSTANFQAVGPITSVAAVPLPPSVLMLGAGLFVLGLSRRKGRLDKADSNGRRL
ncbi:hypothetical protein ABVF61_12450 [Roseibium sp. HPY-6]|uniref:hypothetical protein n=1 Tax=Roseibium sp. HPY-6 TaxID=3229852 RepID=UPI00338FEA06